MMSGTRVAALAFGLVWSTLSAAQAPQVATFKNASSKVVYVEVVSGALSKKSDRCFDAASMDLQRHAQAFPLNPGETRSVTVSSAGKASGFCYAASGHENIALFPKYCGRGDVGETVTIGGPGQRLCAWDFESGTKPQFKAAQTKSALGGDLEISIGSWNDPLTLPHTRTTCIGYAWGHWPWSDNWSTCNQWGTDCQFMRNEAFLIVSGPGDAGQLQQAANACLQRSVIAAALAGAAAAIVTGGGAAAAAEQAFTDVFVSCMTEAAITASARFEIRSHWTDWGSCTH